MVGPFPQGSKGLPGGAAFGVECCRDAAGTSAARLLWYLVWTYVLASAAAVGVTFFLVLLGFEFTLRQWGLFVAIAAFVIPCYTLPDIVMIARHIRPITTVLQALDRGERPTSADASRAIVRALNLPFFSFLRVTLFHGPAAALCAGLGLYVANRVADGGFATWQIVGLTLSIFLFASPAHAISEFFVIAKRIIPQVERLWAYCERVELEDQKRIIAIRLRSKLLYLSIFVNSLPLLFFAGTIVFKVDRLLAEPRGRRPHRARCGRSCRGRSGWSWSAWSARSPCRCSPPPRCRARRPGWPRQCAASSTAISTTT